MFKIWGEISILPILENVQITCKELPAKHLCGKTYRVRKCVLSDKSYLIKETTTPEKPKRKNVKRAYCTPYAYGLLMAFTGLNRRVNALKVYFNVNNIKTAFTGK